MVCGWYSRYTALPRVGELVGVTRSDGRITVAQVEFPDERTPPGCVRLTVSPCGSLLKNATPSYLYNLNFVPDWSNTAPAAVGYFNLNLCILFSKILAEQ